jgi:hypothetical protein
MGAIQLSLNDGYAPVARPNLIDDNVAGLHSEKRRSLRFGTRFL